MNRLKLTVLSCLVAIITAGCPAEPQKLSTADFRFIADRIYQNECGGSERYLVTWNKGEEFPSLGIGHFIWYPKGVQGPFTESFPALLDYAAEQNLPLPAGLSSGSPAPWDSRQQFISGLNSPFTTELRSWLKDNRNVQAAFIVDRFYAALPSLLEHAAESQQSAISGRVEMLLAQPHGAYALIDYVNFKGEGINPKERYKGQGWGLLQVLQQMDERPDLLNAFADSAAAVLKQRINNSPPERGEQRWLAGWLNRINTYRPS